jgi:hypothetical protein
VPEFARLAPADRSPPDEGEKRGTAEQKLRRNVIYLTKKPAKIRDSSTTGVTDFAKSLRQRLQIFAI